MAGRKTYSGAAADTSLDGAITSTATSLVLVDGSTYGAPTAAAPMVIVVGPATATEEQILISARSGNTLTVAASGRNYHLGGSGTGVAHNNAEVVKHVLDADSIDEANAHVNDDARDDHSQYHTAARFVTAHDVTARHPTAVIADGAITTVKIADANVTAAKLAAAIPLGTLGYAQVTANQTGIGTAETDLTGLSVAVTVGTSRRVRVTGCVRVSAQNANTNIGLRCKEGATVLKLTETTLVAAGTGETLIVEWVGTPSAAAHTYKLAVTFGSGTSNSGNASATDPAYILVEDIGAA